VIESFKVTHDTVTGAMAKGSGGSFIQDIDSKRAHKEDFAQPQLKGPSAE
jgi:hypothetical protein